MTRVVLTEEAVLREPRRFAALFRQWAFKLEEVVRTRPGRKAGKRSAAATRNAAAGEVCTTP